MKRLKFYWHASTEQLEILKRLAHVTGHESIRELMGTIVNAGIETLTKQLKESAEPADKSSNSIVQGDPASGDT